MFTEGSPRFSDRALGWGGLCSEPVVQRKQRFVFALGFRTRPYETSSRSLLPTIDTIRSDSKEKRVSLILTSLFSAWLCQVTAGEDVCPPESLLKPCVCTKTKLSVALLQHLFNTKISALNRLVCWLIIMHDHVLPRLFDLYFATYCVICSVVETEGFKIDTMGTYHGMTLKSVTVRTLLFVLMVLSVFTPTSLLTRVETPVSDFLSATAAASLSHRLNSLVCV